MEVARERHGCCSSVKMGAQEALFDRRGVPCQVKPIVCGRTMAKPSPDCAPDGTQSRAA